MEVVELSDLRYVPKPLKAFLRLLSGSSAEQLHGTESGIGPLANFEHSPGRYQTIHFPEDVEDEGVGSLLVNGDSGSGYKTRDGRRVYKASEAEIAQLRRAGIRFDAVRPSD
jgi:hypothetical protein